MSIFLTVALSFAATSALWAALVWLACWLELIETKSVWPKMTATFRSWLPRWRSR